MQKANMFKKVDILKKEYALLKVSGADDSESKEYLDTQKTLLLKKIVFLQQEILENLVQNMNK